MLIVFFGIFVVLCSVGVVVILIVYFIILYIYKLFKMLLNFLILCSVFLNSYSWFLQKKDKVFFQVQEYFVDSFFFFLLKNGIFFFLFKFFIYVYWWFEVLYIQKLDRRFGIAKVVVEKLSNFELLNIYRLFCWFIQEVVFFL